MIGMGWSSNGWYQRDRTMIKALEGRWDYTFHSRPREGTWWMVKGIIINSVIDNHIIDGKWK